jgi:hypothetical protein
MNENKIRTMTARVVQSIGLAFFIWLFGLFVILPLAQGITLTQGFIAFIILIPIAILFFRAVPAIREFSEAMGEAHHQRRKTWIDSPRPFVHLWYAIWLLIAGILFIPILYMIHPFFAGFAVFILVSGIVYMFIIDFSYLNEYLVRYMRPTQGGQQPQKPQGQ